MRLAPPTPAITATIAAVINGSLNIGIHHLHHAEGPVNAVFWIFEIILLIKS